MSLDLGKQFKSLLEPEMMEEGFVDQTLHLKIHRFTSGSASEELETLELGPLPRWFTLYEVKLALWNLKQRQPSFSPALVFMGIKEGKAEEAPEEAHVEEALEEAVEEAPVEEAPVEEAPVEKPAEKPVEEARVEEKPDTPVLRQALGLAPKKRTIIKLGKPYVDPAPAPAPATVAEASVEPRKRTVIKLGKPYVPPGSNVKKGGSQLMGGANTYMPIEVLWKTDTYFPLISPELRMTGPPDDRFVDSTGSQKSVGKTNRIRMTLADIFELDKAKGIPEIHVFLYTDLIDRIVGPRPLGEKDAYGRIIPYFPYLDPADMPDSTGQSVITPIILAQADQTSAALKQCKYLSNLLTDLEGDLKLPKLDGVKFIRWAWNVSPSNWEGPAILFFGTRVTHERPFMRFFPGTGQPLTKIHVKGLLPIPDLADPSLLMTWKQDKNPDVGKDSMYMKLALSESRDTPLYATMRIWNDGTSDLLIQPSKQKRLLDPYSDL